MSQNTVQKALPPTPLELDKEGLSRRMDGMERGKELARGIMTGKANLAPIRFIPLSSIPTPPDSPQHTPKFADSPQFRIPPSPTTPTPRSQTQNQVATHPIYNNPSTSTSTITAPSMSTTTINTPMLPRIPSKKVTLIDPSPNDWGWQRPSQTEPSTPMSTSSLSRKKSNGQLLAGIGKGLGRVGSVMRRNNWESNMSSPASGRLGRSASSWRKRSAKPEVVQEDWEKIEKDSTSAERLIRKEQEEERDLGDVGVSRPFNVEHDLHVSPDLADLPPAWLASLREQGLTEQDLLLIAAARVKQRTASMQPVLHNRPPLKADMPQSVTGSISSLNMLGIGISEEPTRLQGVSQTPNSGLDGLEDSLGEKGEEAEMEILQKFSFEGPSRRESDHEWVKNSGTMYNDEPNDNEPVTRSPSRYRSSTSNSPRSKKRISDQLRSFSKLQLGDNDDQWASSLLSAIEGEKSLEERPTLPLAGSSKSQTSPSSSTKSIKRIPVPTLTNTTPSPPRITSAHSPSLPHKTDVLGLHYSTSQSSLDLDIITPSTSLNSDLTSPPSDESHTSTTNHFSPSPKDPSFHHSQYSPPDLPLHMPLPLSPQPHPNPHYSLPATATSHTTPSPHLSDSEISIDSDPLSRLDGADREERASIALSMLTCSSGWERGSGSYIYGNGGGLGISGMKGDRRGLHESLRAATVQRAHKRVLRNVGEVESEGEESEGGGSAFDALEEAARRIAGEGRFADGEE